MQGGGEGMRRGGRSSVPLAISRLAASARRAARPKSEMRRSGGVLAERRMLAGLRSPCTMPRTREDQGKGKTRDDDDERMSTIRGG